MGQDGYLVTHEWNFYVFETSLILPVFVIFNWYHPSRYLTNIGFRQNRPDGEELHASKWYSPAKYIPALRKARNEENKGQTDVELRSGLGWEASNEGKTIPIKAEIESV